MPCFPACSLPVARLVAFVALVAASPLATAVAPADTLARIRETHTVVIANRESAFPFSYLDQKGQPVGYSVELCQRVVERLRKELSMPDLKAKYITVSGAERIPKIRSGEADMECGSTTNTKSREEQVSFSYTIFVAGMKLLARKDSGITSLASLTRGNIALSKGTTSEKLFNELRGNEVKDVSFQVFDSNTAAFKALTAGKAIAFPQDDVLLSGLLSASPDRDKYALTNDYLSVEPYAIMVRKDDTDFLKIIDKALADTYASGEIRQIYARWFDTPRMRVPMSRLTQEAFTRPAKDSGFARVLGYTL